MSSSGNPINLVVSPFTPRTRLVDEQGYATWEMLKFAQGLAQAVNNALSILGQFNGVIGPGATVAGHVGTLAANIQNLNSSGLLAATALTGVVAPTQLPAALDTTQGAVVLPLGAPSNVLDTAAFYPATAFDAAGSAAAAQSNAETFATTSDTAVLTAAEAFSSNASNLSSGVVPNARLSGISGTVHLGPYTVGGTQGSLTLTNGLITAFVDPT